MILDSVLCVSLMLGVSANTFPGADVTASHGGINTNIHNIVGVGGYTGLVVKSRRCEWTDYQRDVDKAYDAMTPAEKQAAIQAALNRGDH